MMSRIDGTLLRVNQLRVHYPIRIGLRTTEHVHAVDDLDLQIEPGDVVGVVGESGCGKSTLAKTIMGLQRPTSGSVEVRGTDIWSLPDRQRMTQIAANLAMVFQDPTSSLNPRLSAGAIVRDPLDINAVGDHASRSARVDELFDLVGLPSSAGSRLPRELSGGQRQRVAIARSLALDPALIVADEPTSALDVSVRAQIINLLVGLRERLNLSMLFISHDIRTIRYLSDRVVVMYLGRIVEEGPADQLAADPRHPYTKALFSAAPSLLEGAADRIVLEGAVPSPRNPPSGCPFRTRCWRVTDECAESWPAPSTNAGRTFYCHNPLDSVEDGS